MNKFNFFSLGGGSAVNESFEKVASYGLMANMIFYLMEAYKMEVVSGSNLLLIWSALSNALAIFGAFLSDSYLGRFNVILLGSISSFLVSYLLYPSLFFPNFCSKFFQQNFLGKLFLFFSS